MQDLHNAVGQYILYEKALRRDAQEQDRILYLAVREETYQDVFTEDFGGMVLEDRTIRLMAFDAKTEEIRRWINKHDTKTS